MSIHTPADPPKRRGLPRVFVAFSVLLGAVVIVAGIVTALTFTSASTVHRHHTFQAADRLRIHPGAGNVTILGERRDDIRVDAEIHRNMFRNDWEPTVSLRDGGTLRLDSDCSVWTFVGSGECGASFTVRVPRSIALAVVDGGSSDVRVARLSGPVDVSSGSGDVELDDYRGSVVTAKAGSGDIELRTQRAPRRLKAEAGSGDVTIAVPDGTYRIDVDTGSGDEDVQLQNDPGAERSIVARTGSGDVAIFPGD